MPALGHPFCSRAGARLANDVFLSGAKTGVHRSCPNASFCFGPLHVNTWCCLPALRGDGAAHTYTGVVRTARQSPLDEKSSLVRVPPLPDKGPRLPGDPAERGGLRGRIAHDGARRAREGARTDAQW